MASAADLLIDARWVIPVAPADQVFEDHAVVVTQGRIVDLLPAAHARNKYTARQSIHLQSHVLLPGLVNLHTHAAMSLMRGLADDLPLMDWLNRHIWPAEARHVTPDFVYDGTLLACAEMLKGGITCFNDMYFYPEETARAALDAGMRAAVGIICIDFPTRYAADAQDYLRKGLAARDRYLGESSLSFCLAPHAPYTVSDRSLEQILTYANEIELPIHIHLHETEDEIKESMTRFGVRPVERLHRLGLICSNLIAVHAVHLNHEEIDLLAHHGASVAHCPSSNLKLASGIAPVTRFVERNLNTGLGTDGAASNNRLDLFEEMRLAALLAKAESTRANSIPAHTALHMATLGPAKALGLDDRIGSIEVGKLADLCAVDLDDLGLTPVYHPASHVVYAAGRNHVSHVWMEGRLKVDQGQLIGIDEERLRANARAWQLKLAEQA
jgi:5-methylthioadenosine/S-adenosylhomocysteine deaminase